MKAVDARVTYAELQQWPEDGRRYELYDGEVIVVPAPIARHQRVALHVLYLLMDYERATGGLAFGAPLDVVLSNYDVIQPDAAFFKRERRHLVRMMESGQAAPDLAVEVLSPGTETPDRGWKMMRLARFGTGEYWIVDPISNTLEIYTNPLHGFVLAGVYDETHDVTSPTLAGLRFPAFKIFTE